MSMKNSGDTIGKSNPRPSGLQRGDSCGVVILNAKNTHISRMDLMLHDGREGTTAQRMQIMLGGIIRGVSKKFGEWCQKTNKTEDTNK
jgi:hypothetical protein